MIMQHAAAEGQQRSASLAFCRDTITRISDKGLLQRAHIETLLSEKVNDRRPNHYPLIEVSMIFIGVLPSVFQAVRSRMQRGPGPRGMDRAAQGEHQVSHFRVVHTIIEPLKKYGTRLG